MAEEFFPHPVFRPGQREVLSRIRDASASSRILVFRAPTGFGKTSVGISFGLMRPPCVHSVRTRNEISPVLRDLRALSGRVRGLSFSFIHSAHAMCPLLRDRRIDAEDFWLNCQLLRESGACGYYLRSLSVSEEDVEEVLRSSGSHVEAVRRISGDLGACPFFSLARLARSSDYVVLTYPYVFSQDLFSTVFPEEDPRGFSAVIDEAHFVTRPSSIFSSEVSAARIRAAVAEIRSLLGGDPFSEGLLERVAALVERGASDERLRKIPRDLLGLGEDVIEHILDRALEVKRRLVGRALARGSPSEAAGRRASIVKVALTLALLEDRRFELFARRGEGGAVAVAAAVDHSVVSEALSRYGSALLMSGTPPPAGYVEKVLGLGGVSYVDALELGAWSPYSNMAVILASQLTSRYSERGDQIYSLYTSYIEAFDRALEGVKMIVYPSYSFMENVVSRMGNRGFVERRGTTVEELAAAVEGEGLLHVVAGGKLSEGIELTSSGRSLVTGVFIAGVPYPQKDDYVEENVARLSTKIPEEEAWDYTYNMEAAIKTLQAAGRAVRSEKDKAVIVLGDRRFMARPLRRYLALRIGAIARNLREFGELLEKASEEFLS